MNLILINKEELDKCETPKEVAMLVHRSPKQSMLPVDLRLLAELAYQNNKLTSDTAIESGTFKCGYETALQDILKLCKK